MNLVWEVRPAPTGGVWAGLWAWVKARVFSLALVFALAFLLLVSLVISAVLAGAAAWFQGPEQALLSRLLEMAVSLLVLTLGFSLLFTYVPDAEIRWRDVWTGGVMTAILFTVGKTAIGYYLGYASGLGLRRGRVDGGAIGVGLLLGPDRVLWRRVHPCLGHAPGARGPPATRRARGGTPDQERGGCRADLGGVNRAVAPADVAARDETPALRKSRAGRGLSALRRNGGGAMHSTTGMTLVLTVVAGWLVGCATAPASRADKEALLAEAARRCGGCAQSTPAWI